MEGRGEPVKPKLQRAGHDAYLRASWLALMALLGSLLAWSLTGALSALIVGVFTLALAIFEIAHPRRS